LPVRPSEMTGRPVWARSGSTARAAALVGAVGLAAVVSVIGLALGSNALAFAGLAAAIVGAGGFALHLIVTERRRHEHAEGELEALVESLGRIAESLDPEQVLERTLREAKDLFGAKASLLARDDTPRSDTAALIPLHIRHERIGALQLVRARPLDREEIARATLLADFASRAVENARLLAEAQVREAERARLSDQLVIAEQEERRRLALFLHDGPVQSLSGISLMLDAVVESLAADRLDEAGQVLTSALARHRDTIRSLRDLSFNIEPVVLRDQGFGPAVRAFAEQVGLSNGIQVDLDVDAGEALAENARVGLYQIIRESVNQALRRGPPKRISIGVTLADDGSVEAVIADDGAGERRRASYDDIEERTRTLSGQLEVEAGQDGGTAVRVTLPSYAAHR
jgi:signal transduction histidine kinase